MGLQTHYFLCVGSSTLVFVCLFVCPLDNKKTLLTRRHRRLGEWLIVWGACWVSTVTWVPVSSNQITQTGMFFIDSFLCEHSRAHINTWSRLLPQMDSVLVAGSNHLLMGPLLTQCVRLAEVWAISLQSSTYSDTCRNLMKCPGLSIPGSVLYLNSSAYTWQPIAKSPKIETKLLTLFGYVSLPSSRIKDR